MVWSLLFRGKTWSYTVCSTNPNQTEQRPTAEPSVARHLQPWEIRNSTETTEIQYFLDADKSPRSTVRDIALWLMGKKDKLLRCLFTEVIKFICLCLSQSCCNAPSERAFSNVQRLKTWQRSTFSLTYIAVISSNRHILQTLKSENLMPHERIYNSHSRKMICVWCFVIL